MSVMETPSDMDEDFAPTTTQLEKFEITPTTPTYRHLKFLNDDASSVGQQNDNRRKTVRSHVMLDVHRRSRQAAMQKLKEKLATEGSLTASGESSSAPPERQMANSQRKRDLRVRKLKPNASSIMPDVEMTPQGEFMLEFISDAGQRGTASHVLIPTNLLDQDISDPFDSFCLPIGRSEVRNLHHFFHNVLPQRKNFQTAIWAVYSTLLPDPAVLLLVLAKAFLHLGMADAQLRLTGYGNDTEFLRYKLEGTRLIGQKLASKDAISDANFLAIVDLITCFTCSGDSDEALTHLRGLRQMLSLRGGMQRLSPFLAYRVILADTAVAAMTGESPLIEVPSSIESLRDRKVVAAISSFSSMNISTSFSMLRYAFALEDFSDRVSANVLLLERDLLVESRIYRDALGGANARMTIREHTAEAMRLAVIIYIELHIVRSWRYSRIIRNLIPRLKEALQRTSIDLDWLNHSNALLLVLCIGGVGAGEGAEKSWFVAQLLRLGSDMELRGFEDVRGAIGITQLLEGDTDEMMRDLWRGVGHSA